MGFWIDYQIVKEQDLRLENYGGTDISIIIASLKGIDDWNAVNGTRNGVYEIEKNVYKR